MIINIRIIYIAITLACNCIEIPYPYKGCRIVKYSNCTCCCRCKFKCSTIALYRNGCNITSCSVSRTCLVEVYGLAVKFYILELRSLRSKLGFSATYKLKLTVCKHTYTRLNCHNNSRSTCLVYSINRSSLIIKPV